MGDTATHLQAQMNFMNIDSITYHNNQINEDAPPEVTAIQGRQYFFCKLSRLANSFGIIIGFSGASHEQSHKLRNNITFHLQLKSAQTRSSFLLGDQRSWYVLLNVP